jgi:hypothetical protein
MKAYQTLLQRARKRPWRSTCLNGNSAHAVRGGMSARLVHTQANQLNRFELTFASFHFNRFAAAHLRGIQPVAVDRFNHASFACAANHDAAAGGDCIAVTVVCHHGIFSSLTCSLRRYFRVAVHGAYKYACLHQMFLFLIKLTLFLYASGADGSTAIDKADRYFH